MKKISILLLPAIIFCTCQNAEKNQLPYESKEVHSKFLSIEVQLLGLEKNHNLQARLKISNIHEKKVIVNDIAISTTEGVWSSVENKFLKFALPAGSDTTLTLFFNPVNDSKLYRFTGMRGLLQQGYIMRIDFNDGNDEYDLNIENVLPEKLFREYKKANSDTIGIYSLSTDSNFIRSQKKYLSEAEGLKEESSFLNISEQEIAMSGLNLRLHAFQKQDTLYGELTMINHGEFDVMSDTSVIGFNYNNGQGRARQIRIEKISGSQLKEEYNMLRKGDRISIKIKQLIAKSDYSNVSFVLNNAFILKTKESLFNQNIKLKSQIVVL